MNKRTNTDITTELKTIRENAESLAEQTKKLEAQLRLARGTRDNVTKAIAMNGTQGPLFIGDETDTSTLINTIERAITGRARTLRELIEITGARRNRISGALVKLQVAKPNVVRNLGDESRAIYFIPEQKRAVRVR